MRDLGPVRSHLLLKLQGEARPTEARRDAMVGIYCTSARAIGAGGPKEAEAIIGMM